MNIIIIEDELKAARSLETIILAIKPHASIVAKLQSVESSVNHLLTNGQPDLIFMDIQLSDGLCFEIFKSVKITCPIIFCTAFEEYTLEAFKANSVDYILKPFSKEEIAEAFKKVDELRNFFQQAILPDLGNLLSKISTPAGKTSFLVFRQNKYINIPTETIAYFYIKFEASIIKCFDEQEYTVNQSLDQIAASLSPTQFFRVNRQFLVNFTAVKEVEPYFMRKLWVKLIVPTPDKVLVNKEKSQALLSWLSDR